MNKIKETIMAITGGEIPGAVHINRKEHEPITDERLSIVLGFVVKVAMIVAGTVLILNAEIMKLVAILVFVAVCSLFYLVSKD